MAALSTALTIARTYLNDDNATLWSDAILIPKAQEAHRELQTKLWAIGSPVVREESSALTITAGTTSITSSSSPALPSDLLQPTKLFEYAATVETRKDAVEMTETIFLPMVAQATTLIYWSWRKESIQLIGASADRKVIIQYRKKITIPTVTTDDIGILFGELYIGSKTAAIAAGTVGNKEVYDYLQDVAAKNFDLVLQNQRGQQTPGTRP